MSNRTRRLVSSKHRDGQTHHLGALRVYASLQGRLNSRDNYTFGSQAKRKSSGQRRTLQTFLIEDIGPKRGDVYRLYQGDARMPDKRPSFSPPRISEHERDELDLLVLDWVERQAIAAVRMRAEYGR